MIDHCKQCKRPSAFTYTKGSFRPICDKCFEKSNIKPKSEPENVGINKNTIHRNDMMRKKKRKKIMEDKKRQKLESENNINKEKEDRLVF